MKISKKIIAAGLLVGILSIFSCQNVNNANESFTVDVSGLVHRKSGAPLDSAVVTFGSPYRRDTTGTDGTFSYSFSSDATKDVSTTLRISHLGFYDSVFNVKYGPNNKSIALGEVILRGLTGAIDSVVTGKPSARAGNIVFRQASPQYISIKGAGGVDVTTLTFEVRDSLGIPVDQDNSVLVHFSLISKPDAATSLNRTSGMTSSAGTATVILSSGLVSGIAQVQAKAAVKRASDTTKIDTLKSEIVSIPIYGGFPDSAHFSMTISKTNMPAASNSATATVSAVLGDKFGNPVQPGTVLYFGTNGGIISPASGVTSTNGSVSTVLTSGKPVPTDGIVTVTAQIGSGENGKVVNNSTDENPFLVKYSRTKSVKTGKNVASPLNVQSVITRSIDVLFSGEPIINTTDNDFVLSANGTKNITFSVADANGNPLSEGTTITVTGVGLDSAGVTMSGSTSVTLPDTRDKSWTSFSVGLTDRNNGNWIAGTQVGLAIEVRSQNGNIKKTITGYLGSVPDDTTGTPTSTREPAQIAFISSTTDHIYVSGVGETEVASFVYEVRDSLGAPLNASKKVAVNFALDFFPNSYTTGGTAPSLVGSVDSSNSAGRVQATIVSGTEAGVVQLKATLAINAKTIYSQPVKLSVYAGFADQKHFTFATPNYNFPGLQRAFQPTLSVTVGIGDRYSNPIVPGTQVYFHSSHGVITGSAATSTGGYASATLSPQNPYPVSPDTLPGMDPGYGRIYAKTIGQDGTLVSDSLLILWTGAPIITNTGASTFTVADGGVSGAFTFQVADIYGHPMSAGTTISVTSTAGTMLGQTSTLMNDTFAKGNGTTTFTVYIGDATPGDANPPDNGEIDVTVTHPVYGTFTLVLATGTVD